MNKGSLRTGFTEWIRKKENRIYIVLMCVICLLLAGNVLLNVFGEDKQVERIKRGEYGEAARIVDIVAETGYGDTKIRKRVQLNLEPKTLSEEEKKNRIQECKASLEKSVLGQNQSMGEISGNLNLPEIDEATGVKIIWNSSRPELITDEGRIIWGASTEEEYVLIRGDLFLDGVQDEWRCNVKYPGEVSEDNQRAAVENQIGELEKNINEYGDDNYVSLPSKLRTGESVSWREPEDNRLMLCALIVLILMFFHKSLKSSENKKKARIRKEEIERDFPYFLDKLVMLLSAGLILSEAMERIYIDYNNHSRKKEKRVLYEEVSSAMDSIKKSNSPLTFELLRMSERLEVREFARLAVIMRDSIESGQDLAEKLEIESELMWKERKNEVQKLGRTADTKLVFPLIIILIVLIVIVMVPAILQM